MPPAHDQAGPAPLGAGFHDLLIAALPVLRQRAFALTRNRADTDDLVQAAVTNALAAQHSYTPDTNFRAWMTRILRNRFFSDIRRRRETIDIDDAPPTMLARSGGQEESLALAELRRNLARLPAGQRLILLMISVQGLSYETAAEELGIAVGTAKCRVFRARRQLRLWTMGAPEPATPLPRPAKPAPVRAKFAAASLPVR
jgi:RNA polymerase sigma-70 factor (ECF subfamily)